MQGDILLPVNLFNCEDNSSQILCHFHLSCIFLSFFFFGLFLLYYISTISPTLSALTGLAVHTMPSAFGSHLFPP